MIMRYIIITVLFLFCEVVSSQSLETPPDLGGLKISAAGATLSLIGVSMKTNATTYVSGKYGYSHIKRETSPSQLRTQTNTLITGGILIITGIIIQNIKLKKNKKS